MKAEDTWKVMRPPLPVSLVTTVDGHGLPNAAPGVWWTPLSYDPPLLLMSRKPESDTTRNVMETGVWATHFPNALYAKEVLHTAKALPHGECELDDVGLKWRWHEHAKLPHPLPIVEGMPFAICWVQSGFDAGDHRVFIGQVGVSGGYDQEHGVMDVMLHRGRNEFMATTMPFQVESY